MRVGGSGSCRIEIKVYNYMAQLEPDSFINRIKVGQPALTQNVFIVNPNPLISSWVRVRFAGYVVIHVGGSCSC